jgi:hypothetical protein
MVNSDPMVTQLWSPITLRNPEDGGDKVSETSVLTTTIWHKVPDRIYIALLLFVNFI